MNTENLKNTENIAKVLDYVPQEIIAKYLWIPIITCASVKVFILDPIMANNYKLHLKVKDLFDADLKPSEDPIIQ